MTEETAKKEKLLQAIGYEFRFLELYPNSAMRKATGMPVGFVEYGDLRFEVYCATHAEIEKLRERIGEKEGTWPTEKDPAKFSILVWNALGGPRGKLADYDLRDELAFVDISWDLRGAMQEAVLAFLWGGPLSRGSPIPSPESIAEDAVQ